MRLVGLAVVLALSLFLAPLAPAAKAQQTAKVPRIGVLWPSTLAMTLRYGHLAPEHLRTAVARLDAALPVPAKLSAHGSAQEGVTEGALLSK